MNKNYMFMRELVAVRVEDWENIPVQSLHHPLILQHLQREEVSWFHSSGQRGCTSLSSSNTCKERR
jgi:hypothetical protein